MSCENFTFFFGHDPKKAGNNAVFSNWYPATFEEIDKSGNIIKYQNTEQYMMAKKAKLFKDKDIMSQIMTTSDPKIIKELGRKVKNFNQKIWEANCKRIVKDGIRLKFTQNDELREILMSTKGTTLVEASPYDCIWGIGLSIYDSRATCRYTWKGLNLLGEILTEIREELS